MRILFVTEDVPATNLGGAGKHAILLANALINIGHEVHLLGVENVDSDHVINHNFNGKFHTLIDFSKTGYKEVAMGIFNPLRNLLLARRVWSGIKQLNVDDFDVIHYHGHISEVGLFIPKRINYVHTLHDQASECMTKIRFKNGTPCDSASSFDCASCATKHKPNILQKMISAFSVKLHRYLSHKVFVKHKAIFVSEFILNRFKANIKDADKINVSVVHNFTDVSAMRSMIEVLPATSPMNNRPVVLIAGRVHSTKGQAPLLEAMSDSLLDMIEVRIAGDGPDLNNLKLKHEKRGVKFLGWLPQTEIYNQSLQADACIVPSIWEEPCGTVTLEALALGKVVFALTRGGTVEQVRYSQFSNQLRLFDTLEELVAALSNADYFKTEVKLSDTADVSQRLPEILNVYAS